jgi:hypothetical protein
VGICRAALWRRRRAQLQGARVACAGGSLFATQVFDFYGDISVFLSDFYRTPMSSHLIFTVAKAMGWGWVLF